MIWEKLLDGVAHNWEFLVRIIIACLCGGLIGLERSHRQKEAGVRTHVILALASAMIMIVSKYGFNDIALLAQNSAGAIRVDVSRIAASVVSGISFLGAGVIFVRGGSIKGLTTAAGTWATAGIGLAIGGGMYAIGVSSTLLLILIQVLLHKFVPFSEAMETNEIQLKLNDESKALTHVTEQLSEHGILVNGIKMKKNDDGTVTVHLTVRIAKSTSLESMLSLINSNPEIQEFTLET